MSLRPFLVIRRVTDLTPQWLNNHGIRGLLIDIDNTITPYHSDEIPDDIFAWLNEIKQAGMNFAPFSNARAHRIKKFCDRFGIENPGIAVKPLNIGLRRALKVLGLERSSVLIVGDQVFTDYLAGKFSGIRTVLVNPISKREFPATRLMRFFERLCGRHNWGYDDLKGKN